MANDDFLRQVMPAVNMYSAPAPMVSMDPNASMAPPPPMGPPPPPMPPPMPPPQGPPLPEMLPPNAHTPPMHSLQRFAMAPPSQEAVAAALAPPSPSAGPTHAAPPPPREDHAPAPPPPPRVVMMPGQRIPAREVQTIGPRSEALIRGGSALEREAVLDRLEGKKTALLHAAMQGSVDADEAATQRDAYAKRMADHQAHLEEVRSSMDADAAALGRDKIVEPTPNFAQVLGVALGGFAHGFSGGKIQNTAWEIVKKQMENDLQVQQMRINSKRGALDAKQRQFQNLVQTYGMDSAKDMWAASQRDYAAAKIREAAAASGIPEIQAEAEAKIKEMKGEEMKLMGSAWLKYQQPTATAPQYMVRNAEGSLIPIPVGSAKAFEQESKLAEQRVAHGNKLEEKFIDVAARREEAAGKGDDVASKGAAEIAKQRQAAGLPKSEAMLSRAQQDLTKAPKISFAKTVLSGVLAPPWMPETMRGAVKSAVLDDSEQAREQSHQAVVNQYINDVTGSGGSLTEMDRIQLAAGNKHSPEARARFYQYVGEQYKSQDRNIKAGQAPAAVEKFKEQSEGLAPRKFKEGKVE